MAQDLQPDYDQAEVRTPAGTKTNPESATTRREIEAGKRNTNFSIVQENRKGE
jgi:hypothetical protein